MFELNSLFDDSHSEVEVYCSTETSQGTFLVHCAMQHYRTMNGEKVIELPRTKVYLIMSDSTVRPLGLGMGLFPDSQRSTVRYDYIKLINGYTKEESTLPSGYRKWTTLYDRTTGLVAYQGMVVNEEPYGPGILFYDNGNRYREGVFKQGDIINGTEYYPDGTMRFSGVWGEHKIWNYPKCGCWESEDHAIRYCGNFRVSNLKYLPRIEYPFEYGPIVLENAPSRRLCERCIRDYEGTYDEQH